MKIFEKLTSLDLETILFFCMYSIIGMIIVIFMTKKSLEDKKNAIFIQKIKVVFYSIIFGGFIILFPWIAVINPPIAIFFFVILCFIIFISSIIHTKIKK